MIPTSEWMIQPVLRLKADRYNGQLHHYLPLAGHSRPITGDQAMSVLSEREAHWPANEFRAHTINGDGRRFGRFLLFGQLTDWAHPAGW